MSANTLTTSRRQSGHRVDDAGNAAARAQVTRVVHALARARWRQIFIDCASIAVFAAVLSSIVAVAAIRFGWLSLPPWAAVLGLLIVALAGAAAAAYFRRPDDLDVAIDADLKLNLKQRLSTAWEFMRNEEQSPATESGNAHGEDHDTIGRLAAQAVKARLPARSRAGQIFVSRANAFAMMTPVAIIALVLVGIVDVDMSARPAFSDTDEMVISEGVRLRDYGKRMQARARQRKLPRSDEQSLRLQELGARMQSGALSRKEALSRLRDLDDDLNRERRDALNQGAQTEVGPLSVQSVSESESAQLRGMSAQELLRRILDGRITPSDAASRILDSDSSALSRRGFSSAQMRDALERFEAGDRKALEDMMEKLSRADQAARDAGELGNAREQVARARESLGDRNVRPSDEQSASDGAASLGADGTPSDAERGEAANIDDGGEAAGAMPGGRGSDPQRDRDRRASNRELGIDESGPLLKAESQIRDGGVFVSEARVLPRAGGITLDNSKIDAQYAQQLEQVLSNEQYPLHYKEFIRRYFLNLSEGVPSSQAGQAPEQLPLREPGREPEQ